MKIYGLKKIMVMAMIVTMLLSMLNVPMQTVYAESNSVSDLVITEIVPNSSGAGQLYEYVEIYNTTSHRIDLNGYQLQYFTTDFAKPANKWTISNKSIEANSALVLWLKKLKDPDVYVPLEDFNANYQVNLLTEQVFEVKLTTTAQGLADTSKRRVAITGADQTLITAAYYNSDVTTDGANSNRDKSVTYRYSGSMDMEKIANGQTATPGILATGQIVGPEAPTNLSAQPDNGAVNLTWTSSVSADAYHVYYYSLGDTSHEVQVTASNTSAQRIENLTNNTEYIFWVTAVAGGEESSSSSFAKVMPKAPIDVIPPSEPTGLTAEPGTNRILLSWNPVSDSNLAGYKVYVDGVLYQTLSAAENQIGIGSLNKNQEFEFSVSSFNHSGIESEHMAVIKAKPSDRLPELLISELVADTDNYEGFDAFEYIELYNASDLEIDLQGYKVIAGWEKVIDRSVKVGSGESVVLWTRRAEIAPISLEAFNSYYFNSYTSKYLSEDQLNIIHNVGGLVNGGGNVTIQDPSGYEVSKASYAKADVPLNRSAIYSYPIDGGIEMVLQAGNQAMTPGTLAPDQAPEKSKQDDVKPQTPSNVQAVAGNGVVLLQWSPNHESDIFKYNIYKDGILEHSVPASKQEFRVYELIGNKAYTFEVSAVDTSDNESDKSAPQSVMPLHQQITQVQRSINNMDSKYKAVWDIGEDGPVIPGLPQDLVPQALAYYEDMNWMLVVSYMTDGRPTTLSILDAATGDLIKSVVLYQQNGEPYTGHAGGIAISKDYAWISSNSSLFKIKLDTLIQAQDNDEVTFIERISVPVNASYTTFADGILWVGEFYEASYTVDPSHTQTTRTGEQHKAWTVGYKLDQDTDSHEQLVGDRTEKAVPDFILSVREKVQGVVVRGDSIILSTSLGRNKDSNLFRYNNPLGEEAHFTATVGTTEVPGWFLDGLSAKPNNSNLTIVPMAEGIIDIGDDLYVVLESGANKYRYTTTYIMDTMLKLNLNQWDQYGVASINGIPSNMKIGENARASVLEARGKSAPIDLTASYIFASSDETIAEITSTGGITAKSQGDVTITATNGTNTLTFQLSVAKTPAPVISTIKLAQGQINKTTKVTGLQEGVTYKYLKGKAGSVVQPSIGDLPDKYTATLTASTNIEVKKDDHIFIVELDQNGKIVRWADFKVAKNDIKHGNGPKKPGQGKP